MNLTDNEGTGEMTSGGRADLVMRVTHERLVPSPTNPRKHFAPGPLHELAENILALARRGLLNGNTELGVQQPLFARVMPGDAEKLEIIAGERRWRAAELAMEMVQDADDAGEVIGRLMVLPVLIKDWGDDEVIEFQLIENLRRDDLTPLEEADGYQRMIGMGNTPETISEKVGTSLLNVLRALKWARLPDLARAAFEARVIGKEHATLIARIPDERERRVATVLVLEDNDYRDAADDDEKGLAKREALLKTALEEGTVDPLSIRQLRELVSEEFMSSLADVAFDQADADLLPVQLDAVGERLSGGACLDCPFKTCNSVLFATEVGRSDKGRALGIDGNVCTQPSCKAEKTRLQWLRDVAEAEAAGVKVLDEKESQAVFNRGSSSLSYGAKYVALDQKPDISLTGHANSGKVKPWEKLLENTGVVPVLARDGTGKTRRLVPKDVAVMAVNEKCATAGKETPLAQAQESRVSDDEYKEEQRKQAEEEKLKKRVYALMLAGVMRAAAARPAGLEEWRWMVSTALHEAGIDKLRGLASGLDVKPLETKKGENVSSGHYAGALVEALAGEGATVGTMMGVLAALLAGGEAWRGLESTRLKEACGLWGVSIAEMKVQARDEVKLKKKGKAPKVGDAGQSVLTTNRNNMEEIQRRSILAERDQESGNAEEEQEQEADKSEHYHCDECGLVCLVPGDEVEKVEAMEDGAFFCVTCDPASHYEPLPNDEQAGWEIPNVESEQIKRRCRVWRAENPGLGFQAMGDAMGITMDEAFRIGDELIDEEFAAKKK